MKQITEFQEWIKEEENEEEENIINRLSLKEERDSGVYNNDFDYEIDNPIDSNTVLQADGQNVAITTQVDQIVESTISEDAYTIKNLDKPVTN